MTSPYPPSDASVPGTQLPPGWPPQQLPGYQSPPLGTSPAEPGPAHHSGKLWPPRRTPTLITLAIVGAIGVVVTLLTVGGAGSIAAHGSMEVDDFNGSCLTDPGFSDITQGTQVVVTNSGGQVVGTSALNYSAQDSAAQSGLQSGLSVCIYTFTVSVPGGLPRYGITVSHRGTVWFTATQMSKGPGLSLSSGGSGF